MIKNSKTHPFANDRPIYLYDRVRQDIFEERHSNETTVIPSITTIILLECQASIIKRITMMSPKRMHNTETVLEAYAPLCLIRQTMRWLLLASLLVLDNVARLLNVQDEMKQLSKKSSSKYQYEEGSETFFGSSTSSVSSTSTCNKKTFFMKRGKNNGSSGSTVPTLSTRCSRPFCTTSDPPTIYPTVVSSLHSPVRRVREKCISMPTTTSKHEKSYATQQTGRHHTRSNSKRKSLALAAAPRVLKETNAWIQKKQSTSSVSGSSCESVQQKRLFTETLQRKEMIQKPYERCCPACLNSQHN